ncbi:Maf family nucleotide pyrophosphatase [uncultured Desulfovibrio sp.]|uniref:Maf family nucleotide pyrophosphatase n=1 Tax=uncultured Desulfovibrio sp. TaxID=167968 RepID=UPI00260733D9|nr:Maf family nucleotide pyrophosphatase [uncultured Desulfovibrio sp.]
MGTSSAEAAFPPLFRLAAGLRLVLASHSPRRRQFLREWGLPFTLLAPSCDEPRPLPGEAPAAYACRAARAKVMAARAAEGRRPAGDRRLLLGADTIVALGADILGKPQSAEHAMAMLRRLSGATHEVISAVCLLGPDDEEVTFHDVSRVRFAAWPDAVLAAYVATHEPDDKAGAYAVQGQGAVLVEAVDGSWSTVVGLPVTPLATIMLQRGWMQPAG